MGRALLPLLLLSAMPGCLENECWTDTDAHWHDPALAAFARDGGERWRPLANGTWQAHAGVGTLGVDADGHAWMRTVAQQRLDADEAKAKVAALFASVPSWPEPSFADFRVEHRRQCV